MSSKLNSKKGRRFFARFVFINLSLKRFVDNNSSVVYWIDGWWWFFSTTILVSSSLFSRVGQTVYILECILTFGVNAPAICGATMPWIVAIVLVIPIIIPPNLKEQNGSRSCGIKVFVINLDYFGKQIPTLILLLCIILFSGYKYWKI